MKKLKSKILVLLISIFSLFVITILSIYNYKNYDSLNNLVRNSLKRMNPIVMDVNAPDKKEIPKNDKKIEFNRKEFENKMFMDMVVYTVLLNDDNSIKDIIGHYSGEVDNKAITAIVKNILSEKDEKREYIGNLYTSEYSYSYLNISPS